MRVVEEGEKKRDKKKIEEEKREEEKREKKRERTGRDRDYLLSFASLLLKSSLRLSSFFSDFSVSLYNFSVTCCMQYQCTASPCCTDHLKCNRSKISFILLWWSDITHIFMLDWITSLRIYHMNQSQLSTFSASTIVNAREISLFSASYPHAINNLPL
jgi:hypothetical protein